MALIVDMHTIMASSFTNDFIRWNAYQKANCIFERLDNDLKDRQFRVVFKAKTFGACVKYGYRCDKDSHFHIWFVFDVYGIADVNDMFSKMNKVHSKWLKSYKCPSDGAEMPRGMINKYSGVVGKEPDFPFPE